MPSAHTPTQESKFPHASFAQFPDLPWMRFEVGERIVIRYRLADGLHDAWERP